jgi:voltage-gated sodium channel
MFGCVTGEGWVDVMYTQMYGCAGYGYGDFEGLCTNSDPHPLGAPLYFCSFMMIGAMVMLNLFIGVITNGMEETRAENDEMERAARGEGGLTVGEELLNLQEDLLGLQERLAAVAKKANSAG